RIDPVRDPKPGRMRRNLHDHPRETIRASVGWRAADLTSAGLFALDAGFPDDLEPLVLLGHHELAELRRAHLHHRSALLRELALERRGGDDLHRLGMETPDDVGGRFGRREDAPPDARLVTGHGLG